ncbi:proline-rich protein HaeIII subfamily 1-like isoform X3 [Melopsittacus undulatus]|uniref:proline-rich protein HaeIII subfamily 1-like isoform X3 n=1 Tax=Melopsittacus undulatus TaxID=13146 RepID=UPI00146C81E7|nr:proline-rich protein HaeIII subfamily 1-like isoform X3 [Melopsittacus undulatus]
MRTAAPGKAQRDRDNGIGTTGRDRSQGSGTGLGLEPGLGQRDRDNETGTTAPGPAPGPRTPMAGADGSPPAGPDTPPCRAVPRVHAFGKGGQALRRDPRAPPAMRGWLRKQLRAASVEAALVCAGRSLPLLLQGSEQRVRGGLPLPGYEIRVLPPAPRAPHAPQFLFTVSIAPWSPTALWGRGRGAYRGSGSLHHGHPRPQAEHPGMRTYCLGAETPEELNAWVCALRRGASPLPRSPQEPRGAGPPSPPLPARCPPLHPPCCTSGPPLPPSKEEAPAQGGRCGTHSTAHGGSRTGCGAPEPAGTADHAPRPRPELTTPPMGRSQREPRGRDATEHDTFVNQTPASPMDFSDWLLPFQGTACPPAAANEASRRAQEGMSGRGSQREGVAGRGARRPIRITLLQASF